MSNFTIGSFSEDGASKLWGFSLTPNVPGPNGNGSAGNATTAKLLQILVGTLQSEATSGEMCYVHTAPVASSDQIQSGYVMSASISAATTTPFGPGSYASLIQFSTSNAPLTVGNTYYFYFKTLKNVFIDDSEPYSGGVTFDEFLDDVGSAQFQATFQTS